MLNIECVAKYCPCGERCTNRAFSSRSYAKLEVKRAGAKGFGLFAAEDIKAGQFIIEYVGEVLEEEEYARRKEFYIATGQRHYYFMNVGNGEVIDAVRRGGLGRFINHSCEPNCETQKWVVMGELAIGLFAIEDVSAGSELTFDYNFERYGDKPMKCLCGSKSCRGVIGGTQEIAARMSEMIVAPEDEEEADLEPIMVTEKEADNTVSAILDRVVGLGWEEGFDSKLQARLQRLAALRGIELPIPSTGGGGGPHGEGSSDGAGDDGPGEDSDEEIAAAALAAKAASVAKYKGSTKKKTPRVPRAKAADPDWGEATPTPAAPSAATPSGAGASAVPSGRRSKASAFADLDELTPARGTGGAAAIARRAASLPTPGSRALLFNRKRPVRRSEVDRRLDNLLGPSGRLRDNTAKSVLSVLRLFNLCDIGPTVIKMKTSSGPEDRIGADAGRSSDAAPTATLTATALPPGLAATGATAATGDDAKAGSNVPAATAVAIANGTEAAGSEKEEGEVSGSGSDGAVGPTPPPPPPPPPPAAAEPSGPVNSGGGDGAAERPARNGSSYPVGGYNGPGSNFREDEGTSRSLVPRGSEENSNREFTARQRARVADLSLLLDVVLKTTNPTARKEFVNCGLLRQVLITVGRNVGPPYAVILRKILRVVEALPISADNVYDTRSAHGSFADLLRCLTQHADYEVRTGSWALMRKWPPSSCQRPIAGEWHSSAGRTRTPLGGGGLGPSGNPPSGTPQAWERGTPGGGGRGGGRGGGPPMDPSEHSRYNSPYGPPPGSGGGGRGPSRLGPGGGGGRGGDRVDRSGPLDRPLPHADIGGGGGRGPPPPYDDRGRDPYYSGNGGPRAGPLRDLPPERYMPPHHGGPGGSGSGGVGPGGEDRGFPPMRKRSRWEPAGPPPPGHGYGGPPGGGGYYPSRDPSQQGGGLPPLPYYEEPPAKHFRGMPLNYRQSNGPGKNSDSVFNRVL